MDKIPGVVWIVIIIIAHIIVGILICFANAIGGLLFNILAFAIIIIVSSIYSKK